MALTASGGHALEAARHAAWLDFLATDHGRRARPEHLTLLGSAVAGDGLWTIHRMTALLDVIERRASRLG